jgi:hypothetical protein
LDVPPSSSGRIKIENSLNFGALDGVSFTSSGDGQRAKLQLLLQLKTCQQEMYK